MPPHLSADRPAARPSQHGSVDALISQTRRLRGEVDAVRREAPVDDEDPRGRWQRALCTLALHQLNDLDEHLAQLREGPPPAAGPSAAGAATAAPPGPAPSPSRGALLSRVGSAEWNLLTDEASWSGELYRILGRDAAAPPLTLDELPSLVLDEDRPMLTAMVTDCLIDAKPIDGEFRVVRPDGGVRTVHMMGEPVLGADGSTAAMWAVLRDVSELRRTERTVTDSRDSLERGQHPAGTGRPPAADPDTASGPPPQDVSRSEHRATGPFGLAAHPALAPTAAPTGGDWYDAFELPDGDALLSAGSLSGRLASDPSAPAMLRGALRGMAVTGTQPGQLLSGLDHLLDTAPRPAARATADPAHGSAVCCRYRPGTGTLTWARTGPFAPLLFRDGTGRALTGPDGVAPGHSPGAGPGQAEETLRAGDVLLLHTAGPAPSLGGGGEDPADTVRDLLRLAPRLGAARTAQDCLGIVLQEFGTTGRADRVCVLVVTVGP